MRLNIKVTSQHFWCFSWTQVCFFFVVPHMYVWFPSLPPLQPSPQPPFFFSFPKEWQAWFDHLAKNIYFMDYTVNRLYLQLKGGGVGGGVWIPRKFVFLAKQIWNIDQLQVPNMMKVNLEFLTSPLVECKQMQNVQYHIFGAFLMLVLITKLPTRGWVSYIQRILHDAALSWRTLFTTTLE